MVAGFASNLVDVIDRSENVKSGIYDDRECRILE